MFEESLGSIARWLFVETVHLVLLWPIFHSEESLWDLAIRPVIINFALKP
jgi:hypothetical protein